MIDKNQTLEELLEAMVTEDDTISARAVVRRSEGVFKHASDITRNEARRRRIEEAIKKQETIRAAVNRSSKKSRTELEKLVAAKNDEIEQIRADREMLVASHRAMILAVAEMGGFSRWRAFFDGYQATIDRLEKIGSIPNAAVISFAPRSEN